MEKGMKDSETFVALVTRTKKRQKELEETYK
jgi:hypothetical protein